MSSPAYTVGGHLQGMVAHKSLHHIGSKDLPHVCVIYTFMYEKSISTKHQQLLIEKFLYLIPPRNSMTETKFLFIMTN